MPKRKAVRVQQELLDEIKKEVAKSEYKSLSEFVSDAIQLRLQTLAKERVQEYLERDRKSRYPELQSRLLYTPRHIHAQPTLQGNARIGITDYFQSQLKEIVNIQTYNVGDKVSRDEPFGEVETWWFTYDLYSPLNGKIVSVNKEVIEDPFVLNVKPCQWIVEVQPEYTEADSWMNGLLDLEDYEKLVTRLEVARAGIRR
ncbi:MAG: hypothetical protein OEZ48_11175 [Candidatus Bathyarchaeota archaeon]|nr:hypothetical protein [Candidatus Bathyarchaeota archaeon]MDH5688406.1 hypothetical protein [Candidatus Bathyarchaeota archaeon]